MDIKLGNKLNSKYSGLAFSVDVVIYIFLGLIVGIVSLPLVGTEAVKYINFLVSPVAIILTLFWVFWYGKIKVKEVYSFKCGPKYYLIAFLLIFGLLFSVGDVNVYFVEFLKLFGYKQKLTPSTMPYLGGANVVLALIVIALLPAVLEEALFRGVILKGLNIDLGEVPAVLLCGLVFMLFHGSAEQSIYQFIAGCSFALLAVRSGSILPTVLMHFLNNAVIIIFSAVNLIDDSGNIALSQTVTLIITILSLISFIVAIVWLIIDLIKNGNKSKGGKSGGFFIYASVGVFVCILLVLVGFVA